MRDEFSLLQKLPTPVTVIERDAHGEPRFALFNDRAAEVSGIASEAILGLTAREALPGKQGQVLYELHQRGFQQKRRVSEHLQVLLNGEQRCVRTVLEPLLNESGDVAQLLGTPVDVTAEQDVAGLSENVAALDRGMEEFISLAAHDLRSPMRKVKMIAEMLRDDFIDLGDGKLEALAMLERVAVRAIEMISDVTSHSQAALAEEQIETFDFSAAIQQSIDAIDPEGKHVLKVNGGRVRTDRRAVQMACRNLADNAIRHNRSASITIEVTLRALNDQRLAITVADSGSGFSEADREVLAGGSLRTDSGFGLAGVRRLIEKRGGTLAVLDAGAGQGASLEFSLAGVLVED